jgi:hypothetical protein
VNRIAAIVVSLPERHELLKEALDSVRAQTRPPDDIVVGVDSRHYGEVANMNRLIDSTDCEWLAFLHDDDIWEPEHLQCCEETHERTLASVVVSRFELVGRPWSTIEPWHEDFNDWTWTNWVGSPSMVMAHRDIWERWCDPFEQYRWIDWANYNRVLRRWGAGVFADTRQRTVQYRFGDWSNGSWQMDKHRDGILKAANLPVDTGGGLD